MLGFSLMLASSIAFALAGAQESDVCHGPLVSIALEGEPAHYYGVEAAFGGHLQLNETLSGSLVLASPLDACGALEPLEGRRHPTGPTHLPPLMQRHGAHHQSGGGMQRLMPCGGVSVT